MIDKTRTHQNNEKKKSKKCLISIKTFVIVLFAALTTLMANIAVNFDNGNGILMMPGIPTANAQQSTSGESGIVDLKVSERNGNFVWESGDNKVNPQINMKANAVYSIQLESMDGNNIEHQLVIQTKDGKELVKSAEISNGETDDFSFTPKTIGTYEYHCEYHPQTMKGTIIVS
jgi:plastocyanin